MSSMEHPRFQGKLKGATARLLAAACEHYMEAATSQCNDTPAFIPIFSRLSPQQRVQLVVEVAVGLLCEDEPLPPNTIQHSAAYLALLETVLTEIEIEDDQVGDTGEVREHLIQLDQEFMCQRKLNKQPLTEVEAKEREIGFKAVEERAQRKKESLGRKKKEKPFHVEEKRQGEFGTAAFNRFSHLMTTLFEGQPDQKETREALKNSLTEQEKFAFRWRLMVDAALQEQTEPLLPLIPPLSTVNFDFRCGNINKWREALSLLLILPIWQPVSRTEESLLQGYITFRDYADSSHHARIQAVQKNVKILRAVYDKTWNPASLGDDQRCIYAVCSNDIYSREEHHAWLMDFVEQCIRSGLELTKGQYGRDVFTTRGNYQKRLAIFRALQAKHADDALKVPFQGFDASPWCHPSEYKLEDSFIRCSGPGEPLMEGMRSLGCFNTENLKMCMQCQVVHYCSKKCQAADWKRHKKECKQMARLGKDKKKVVELAKTL